MKKILIRHMGFTYNYGTMMMGVTLINYFNDKLKGNVKFYIDAKEDIHVDRMKSATGIDNIHKEEYQYINKSNFLPLRRIQSVFEITGYAKYCENYDAVFVIGGDDLSEYYGKLSFVSSALKSMLANKKGKVFLIGQTVGPFTGKTKILASKILKNLNIYTRDPKCTEYLKEELRLTNVFEARDLAFLKLPGQITSKSNILEKFNLEKEKYITLVPSGLGHHYTKNSNAYIECWVKLIENLYGKNNFEKIVLLAHVVGEVSYSDKVAIDKIMNKLPKEIKENIKVIKDTIYPLDAREILGNGILTITGRMHAAISTFEMRKPAISLSYSVKYEGVIGRGLDLEELVIEAKNDQLWSSEKILELIEDKVDYIEKNYDILRDKIDKKVKHCEKLATKQLEDVGVKLGW